MKGKETGSRILQKVRSAVARLTMGLGGVLAVGGTLCSLAALLGAFGNRQRIGAVMLFLVLGCAGIMMLAYGRWPQNSSGKKTQPKPAPHLPAKKTQQKPAQQVSAEPVPPLPTEDQKRLEEIEREMDLAAGSLKANPMSPGTLANEALLVALRQEKQTRLRRMVKGLESITVHTAWKTFTPEQQLRFDMQVYQYTQDVERGGLEREAAAANRGLVFVENTPVPAAAAARLKELHEVAAAEKAMENGMENELGYPVPVKAVLIYPSHIVPRERPRQVLYEDETVSYGARYKETVYLLAGGFGRMDPEQPVLVCEKQEWSEHGSQWDTEGSIVAALCEPPRPCHHIPLVKWILALPYKNLRQYTSEVWIKPPTQPLEYEFRRYISLRYTENKADQYGWNCTRDEIGLSFDSSEICLCRDSRWREMPSGQTYAFTVIMKLLPGVEKEARQTLCSLMDSLPWWNPNEMEKTMRTARNWLNADYLRSEEAALAASAARMPYHSGYAKSLGEVRRQLKLLEEQ